MKRVLCVCAACLFAAFLCAGDFKTLKWGDSVEKVLKSYPNVREIGINNSPLLQQSALLFFSVKRLPKNSRVFELPENSLVYGICFHFVNNKLYQVVEIYGNTDTLNLARNILKEGYGGWDSSFFTSQHVGEVDVRYEQDWLVRNFKNRTNVLAHIAKRFRISTEELEQCYLYIRYTDIKTEQKLLAAQNATQ